MAEINLDIERQQKAKEYSRLSRRLMLIDLSLGGIYVLAWLFGGWGAALKDALVSITTNEWLVVPGFAAVFGSLYIIINLPLSYYEGFVLPHRYGLSNQSLRDWIVDQIKEGLIGAIFGVFLLEIIYAVLRAAPDTWWLWAGLIMLLLTVVIANLAPILIYPIFYKFVPLDNEHAELAKRLVRLAERAHVRVQGVFKFDMSRRTSAANAALTGLGSTRRIIIGDTLLQEFSDDEIETVLAHELGHHVHKDIPVGIVVQGVLTLGGLYLAHLGLKWGIGYFGFEGVGDIAAFPLFLLVMGAYSLVTMPLTNGYSRWREVRADEYALQSTGKPAAFATAMTRLANQNLSEVDPEPWVEWLLYSHPALGKRIAMANSYQD